MDQHMIIDELRKELRHMKGRRDFYMAEVSRLKVDYRTLHDTYLSLQCEHSELRRELNAAQRAARKEDQGGSQV